jgi:hypothetical protein
MNLAATAPRTVGEMRRRDLAFIHVAKKQLGLNEESYRDLIRRFSGGRTETSAELQVVERIKLMDHLKSLGAGKVKGRGADEREQASKLRALWRSLYHLGEVENPSDLALTAYVMRQTGMAALRWNRGADLNKAIECLKGWCDRIGYVPRRCDVPGACFNRFEPALIEAQWNQLRALGAFRHATDDNLSAWLRDHFPAQYPALLSADDAQDAVRSLGYRIRREQARIARAEHKAAAAVTP